MTRLSTKPKIVVEGCVPRLRGDLGFKYHDSIFGGKILVEMENEVFDNLTSTLSFPVERPPRMVFGEDSQIGFEGDHSEPKGKDTIVPSKFPQLLLKENMLDVKSFKDKLPSGIEQNLQFQRLGRYPVSARAFDDPILFLDGLQSLWEHGQQRPAILGRKEPLRTDEEPVIEHAIEPATDPVNERMDTTADSRGVLKEILFVGSRLQAVWIMPVNRRSRELLKDIEKMRG
ncbi:hypothetical protein Tco_1183151 [Tanacetum coccineum]